jgi:drug/metabolite transporter (DMT)-like permease
VGYLYTLLAALLFGLNGSMTKAVIDSGFTPTQLTQFRSTGTAVVLGIILLVVDRSAFKLTRRQLLTMVVLGVTGVGMLQAAYAFAIQLLPVGITLLIEYTAVLMVALVALFFFKEKVKARLWVAIGCVLIGLAVIAQVWTSTLNPWGVLIAFFAAIMLTSYFVIGERQVTATSPLVVAFWTMAVASLMWAPFSGWWQIDPNLFGRPVSLGGNLAAIVVPVWAPLAWNVILGTLVPYFLSFLGLKHLSATAAGIVAASEVVFAFLVAWLWLQQGLNVVQILGAAVVLTGIILAQTARSNKVSDVVGPT